MVRNDLFWWHTTVGIVATGNLATLPQNLASFSLLLFPAQQKGVWDKRQGQLICHSNKKQFLTQFNEIALEKNITHCPRLWLTLKSYSFHLCCSN